MRCRLKHCDKCGTYYNDQLGQCPKCFPVSDLIRTAEQNAPKPEKRTLKKQWLAILIGIPVMILLYYLVIGLLKLAAS